MAADLIARIGSEHLAAAIKLLPKAETSRETTRYLNYPVPGLGLVRLEFTRTTTRHGRFGQTFWALSAAHPITMTFD